MSQPQNPFESPPPVANQVANPAAGDATGGVIPYKNPPALIAYYLSIFGLFPCLGIVLSIPAVVLGIMGLRKRQQNPAVKGSVHAWIGIILGGVCTLFHVIGWAMMAVSIAASR